MLDLFVIFGKGGLVLWCFQASKDMILTSVNALIRTVILQERTGDGTFEHDSLMLQYKLDNEFELVFVAGYQKVLQLSYVDKLLDDMKREIRDRYKNQLLDKRLFFQGVDLADLYQEVLKDAEIWSFEVASQPRVMRTFDKSIKSKKTVASMIERPDLIDNKKVKKEKEKTVKSSELDYNENGDDDEAEEGVVESEENAFQGLNLPIKSAVGMKGGMRKATKAPPKSPKSPGQNKGKKQTKWDLSGSAKDAKELDYTKPSDGQQVLRDYVPDRSMVGKMAGGIRALEVADDLKKSESGRVMNLFKGLVGGKTLTLDDMTPSLEKLKDHLIGKNVASDVAGKICDSVGAKLNGKVLGTFQTVGSTVKGALEESLLTLLRPRRQVDVLREALEAKRQGRPFIVTFCGVNGVGKSTNLAKICFWLIENDMRVLIAACDTFRAGAVEQLRTHVRHLNALHPPKNGKPFVELYEKGYGKDAAGVAAEAISFAKDSRQDIVLVDTAGRMQDNAPLMRSLAKLIRVNNPDLVLFVGEALVGNEAVDQLVKFNTSLADFSDEANPHLIDGIVLTKFDTIDDKVGAAVSMAYITGQPIVFVGTGQTYTDLRSLDSEAVVAALMN
ncbi:unnamed protein product [Orchesella dallaii]|uniref:SRP54-type proteins GTP-binding domain-containing protein n=1 Tax=Orchesella dallaii TaxID=48710 RepID=A0ABP1QUS2_9HEXA